MLVQGRPARVVGADADLALMDAERLAPADDAFDTAVASLVFCSAPAPIAGLQELSRVVKPAGRVVLP